MKKCIDCDFWFNTECIGLLRAVESIKIVVAGGYSAPDSITTSGDFGCLAHSGYLDQQVTYIHDSCGGVFTKSQVDSFKKPNGNTSFKICPQCNDWIEVDDLAINLVS